MPDDNKSDLVMQFVLNGNPVLAECVLDKHPYDTMMTDFKPADYDDYSNFFEVQKFSFGCEVKGEDSTKEKGQAKAKASATPGTTSSHGSHNIVSSTGAKDQGAKEKKNDPFRDWRSATDKQVKALQFPFEPDNFTITRLIDRASPTFFEACCKSLTFDSATLVKRISVGSLRAQDSALGVNTAAASIGFLQFKFYKVLIVSLDWDDDQMVNENCDFICQKFEIKYRKQNANGSLDAAVPASWDKINDVMPKLQGVG